MDSATTATPLASTTQVETRDPRTCNKVQVSGNCWNRPVPGEFYCLQHLHPHRMIPHAEKLIKEATSRLEFLGANVDKLVFAPARNLLTKAQTALDAYAPHQAFFFANQAIQKAIELSTRPRIQEAIQLRDEVGFLDARATLAVTNAEQELAKPWPDWAKASQLAAQANLVLRPLKQRAEANRRLREEREAAEQAAREARAAAALAHVGEPSINTGMLSDEDRYELEQLRHHAPAPDTDERRQGEGSKRGKNKKRPTSKRRQPVPA